MSYDIDLLHVVRTKAVYNRFKEHVKKHTVSTLTMDIFNVLGEYWDNYPTRTEMDFAEFKTFYFIVRSKKIKDPAKYEEAFKNLEDSFSAPRPIEKDLLRKLVEADYATQIYNVCLGIGLGKGGDLDSIEPMLKDYRKEIGSSVEKEDVFVSPSLSYVYTASCVMVGR